jgi:hypothetical protein
MIGVKRGKRFDCVRMKTEIQERLLREIAELGEEELPDAGATGWLMIQSWALLGSASPRLQARTPNRPRQPGGFDTPIRSFPAGSGSTGVLGR